MSQNLPNMLQDTISKIREMVDVNNVIGEPIVVGDITIIPVSKVSVGFGGGGSDYVKNVGSGEPFGGGVGGGVKVNPICFLIIKDGMIRFVSTKAPADTSLDRALDMIPDIFDRVEKLIHDVKGKKNTAE